MKNNDKLSIDTNNQKPIEKPKGHIIPQSTKYSTHSKLKGFSFQIDKGELSKDQLNDLDNKLKEKSSEFKIENSQKLTHKSKQSYVQGSSGLLSNKQDAIENKLEDQDIQKKDQQIPVKQNGIDIPLHITDIIKDQNFVALSKSILNQKFDKYENTRYSTKSLNIIKSFAANTHQGVVRKYNEDRVSIILNIVKPNSYKGSYWPACSFFGVFDGHGGNKCADFLKDNLHNFIIKSPYFPKNPTKSIIDGFNQCDEEFISNHALGPNNIVIDRSGSCAIVVMIIDKQIFVANTGDSRAIMCVNNSITALSNDHKPNNENEKKRIVDEGGKIYQTQTQAKNFNIKLDGISPEQTLLGPFRVFPGRLSVSRSFGDVEAKLPMFNGNPNVLISTPEIKIFDLSNTLEWMVLACK